MAKKAYPRIRLFQSDFLESFSTVHPIVPVLVYGPLFTILIWVDAAPMVEKITLIFAGIFLWTLLEYILHRFVFHFLSKNKLAQRITFLLHGIHHKDPRDPLRLVAPPLMSLVIASILFLPFVFLLSALIWKALVAGVILGYLIYDYCHYYFHHFTPKLAYFKYLRKNHFAHHFKTPRKKYGVSSPL